VKQTTHDYAVRFCEQMKTELDKAEADLAAMRADMEAAAGELHVSVKDCAPGTLCGKLLSANVILRHNRADLLSRSVDAEARAEKAEAKARMLDDAAAMLDTLGIDRASQTGSAFTVQHRIGILNDEAEREKGLAFAAVEKAEAELTQWRWRSAGLLREASAHLDYYDPETASCGIAQRIKDTLAKLGEK